MVDKFAEQIAIDKNLSHDALVLTKPEPRARYDMILALRAAARVMAGEPLPSPEAVAQTDLQWERDVQNAIMRIKFEEDYNKRPAALQ